jgi:hypothetical protein
MASATGIEIGADSYLFTDVRRGRTGEAEILSLRRFAESEWPADGDRFIDALRSIRRDHRFPRRAAVVSWNPAEGTDLVRHDPLASLTAAGFEIVSVMPPPQALARVATTVQRGAPSDAIAWLALNTCGASIAIVRDGQLLFSRTFPWTYTNDLETSKAQLLQRYVLISHIAPELDHGVKTVREVDGATVSLIVTCGNLPELRSLTLPLIEELDVEVETLDSTDGLLAGRNARADQFTDLASALRLATAAALTSALPRRDSVLTQGLRFAAAAAGIAALAWAGYSFWLAPSEREIKEVDGLRSQPSPARAAGAPQRTPSPSSSDSPSPQSTPLPVATRGSDEPNRATPSATDTSRRLSTEQSRRIPSDTKTAAPPQVSSPAGSLNEPLPRIDTVLIDQDRRLAILDGAVVGIGDPIGSRVVVAIAREAILLREPSGRIVRVRPRVGM